VLQARGVNLLVLAAVSTTRRLDVADGKVTEH
jgi:hypothetical protein